MGHDRRKVGPGVVPGVYSDQRAVWSDSRHAQTFLTCRSDRAAKTCLGEGQGAGHALSPLWASTEWGTKSGKLFSTYTCVVFLSPSLSDLRLEAGPQPYKAADPRRAGESCTSQPRSIARCRANFNCRLGHPSFSCSPFATQKVFVGPWCAFSQLKSAKRCGSTTSRSTSLVDSETPCWPKRLRPSIVIFHEDLVQRTTSSSGNGLSKSSLIVCARFSNASKLSHAWASRES